MLVSGLSYRRPRSETVNGRNRPLTDGSTMQTGVSDNSVTITPFLGFRTLVWRSRRQPSTGEKPLFDAPMSIWRVDWCGRYAARAFAFSSADAQVFQACQIARMR